MPSFLVSLPVGVRIDVGGIGLDDGVGGWWTVVAFAEELQGVLFVVGVGAASPEDAVGGLVHDAAGGLEEDVGQGRAVAGEEGFGCGGEMPLPSERWRVALAGELLCVDLIHLEGVGQDGQKEHDDDVMVSMRRP